MKERAAKEWGQRFWWSPNQMEPSRAPNLEAALP
jgi:hypothetical protein